MLVLWMPKYTWQYASGSPYWFPSPTGSKGQCVSYHWGFSAFLFLYNLYCFCLFPSKFLKLQRMRVIRDLPAKLGPISSLSFQLEVDATSTMTSQSWHSLAVPSDESESPSPSGTWTWTGIFCSCRRTTRYNHGDPTTQRLKATSRSSILVTILLFQ